ncbi:MAG: response regulator [Acidobacteriota bacterium]
MLERTEFEQWRSKEVARLLALVETERRYYQEMVAQLPVPLAVLAENGSIAWANRSFRRTFNLRGEDLRRKGIEQLFVGDGWAEWLAGAFHGTVPTPRTVELAGESTRVAAVPMRNWEDDTENEVLLVVEIGAGTVEVPAEALIPPDLPAIVWTADAESTDFRTVAGAAQEFLGYPLNHWLDRPGFFEERIHPDDRPSVMEVYRSLLDRGGDGSAEFRAVTASGQAFWCRESIRVASVGGTPRGITGVLTNITRRKQMEQQLLSGSRLEAMQNLAGRLAHDLNNPLMIIHGYGEEMLQSLDGASPLRADAQEIVTAAGRISSVAGKLTELARHPARDAVKVDIAAILADLRARLVEAAGPGVTVELTTPSQALWAMADPEQLAAAILTIASHDHEGTQGRTRLSVSCDLDSVAERLPFTVLAPGSYVCITLRDDGKGVESSKIAAIFDPILHATHGEGLGLARAHGVVRHWGGDIAVASEPQRGTQFSLFLPAAAVEVIVPAPAATPPPAPEPEPVPVPEPEPVKETILIVDDEAGIRGLMRKILRREHYNVIEAATAEEALQLAAATRAPIHLLLTDVMLPGMLGPELAQKMYESDPALKVLYISGYTQDESVRAGGEYPPGARFLAKPFTLGALLAKCVRRWTLTRPLSKLALSFALNRRVGSPQSLCHAGRSDVLSGRDSIAAAGAVTGTVDGSCRV